MLQNKKSVINLRLPKPKPCIGTGLPMGVVNCWLNHSQTPYRLLAIVYEAKWYHAAKRSTNSNSDIEPADEEARRRSITTLNESRLVLSSLQEGCKIVKGRRASGRNITYCPAAPARPWCVERFDSRPNASTTGNRARSSRSSRGVFDRMYRVLAVSGGL